MTVADQNLIKPDENADVPPHPGRRMTEEEFVEWCGDFWAEWVDGEVLMMMTVSSEHAFLQGFLYSLIRLFVEERDLGRAYAEPFQIRLGPQRRRRAPDVFFIAKDREHLIKKHNFEGGPDLIVEIVSPESESRDWRDKYHEYEAAGVREYWVVNPTSGRTEAYTLADRRYTPVPIVDGKIPSVVLPGFHIRPTWILAQPLPRVREALRDMGL